MVGGWSKDQIGYINRNTNLFYHRPEIITEIIKQGKRERKGKFWIANLIKSNKDQDLFKDLLTKSILIQSYLVNKWSL